MRSLVISIEIKGVEHKVGNITGNSSEDAFFCYSQEYIESVGRPISISLPIQQEAFSAIQTKNYFEGLLPEGFSRRAVAAWMHTDEEDYLTILAKLGYECIGALRVTEESVAPVPAEYVRLTEDKIKALASEGAAKSTEILMESHLSLTGASGKVGLYYDQGRNIWYQPKGDAPSTHIIKQSHVRLDRLVVNELLCFNAARKMGIDTPDCFLIDIGEGTDEDILFATKRYDRVEASEKVLNGLRILYRLHQEDFAQALGISSSEKYEKDHAGYMRMMFECIRKYSSNPIEDQLKLWDMIIFNYLIGNTDGHIKNFSLIYDRALRSIRLAPAYDMVSTRVYGLAKDMAFGIGGTYNIDEMNRDTFKAAAKEAGLGERMALNRFDYMQDIFERKITDAAKELSDSGLKDVADIKDRILRIN